jgi:NAD(P)-dependent dehydrogenase (short-subunit alcohol dehydrogenase family)
VVIVTGASAGIGEATVRRLASEGCSVAAVARSVAGRAWPDGKVVNYPCDVRRESEVTSTVDAVLERFGRVDAVVSAAGILRGAPVGAALADDIRAQLEVNLLGSILMAERCTSSLVGSRGSIVNFSSTLAEHPAPGMSAYAASKGGIEAYTRAVALELGPSGVRANCVRLGLVRTGIHLAAGRSEDESDAIFEKGGARLPLGRVGTPEEVAGVVCYLLSAAAAWITGTSLVLDGGRSIS